MEESQQGIDSRDLTTAIQTAVDADRRDSQQVAFLRYLQEDLPVLVRAVFDHHGVFLSVRDAVHVKDDCRSIFVGESPLPKQSRTHKHGDYDYRFETGSVKKTAYIDFCHPTIGEIWEDVRGCAIGAAVTAVVAAILSESFEVAKATFYPMFYACLVSRIGDRAKEVSVDFHTDTEYGCWENHCG